MAEMVLHPGLVLLLGALALGALPGGARRPLGVMLPLLALCLVWQLPGGVAWEARWLGHEVAPIRVDALARLFATIFALAAAAGALFAWTQPSRWEVPAALAYAGAAIGAVFAGDLLTLFVFWELMAVASTVVLWSAGTRAAYAAARRYLTLHLLGGMLLFAGIAGQVGASGSVAFEAMRPETPARMLILAGFLLNAAAPPISAWLPDAYPEASWSGTVFLSAFTTKTAVYALIRGFPGTELLIWVGAFMIFYGIVYALLENDMRRILAYSIVNQVGFMVVGVGIGTEMALNGAAAHAFTHIIYKALLLMSAGSVLLVTGRRKCSELGGLFHTMPLTTLCGIVGALSISSFPLTSGFVSKSMVTQAAVDGHLATVWLLLTAASAGVFLHAGIKFPWFVFFQKDSGLRPPEPPAAARWAMVLLAVLCIVLGVWPQLLYALLPHPVAYVPYTAAHVLTQLQLLMFSGLAFFVLLPLLKRTPTITLDADWLWRRAAPALASPLVRALSRLDRALRRGVRALVRGAGTGIQHLYGPNSALARPWPTHAMAIAVLLVLLAYLVLYYI